MLYECHKRSALISLESITTSISEAEQVNTSFADSLKVLCNMINQGSQMANLERPTAKEQCSSCVTMALMPSK